MTHTSVHAHPEIAGLSSWRPLARGGLAVVWEAHQATPDRLVAVKVYEHGLHEADLRHFVREAAAADRLAAHPGIVTTYSVGRLADKRPYLVMELCPGGSLTRWLEPEHRPSPEQVRQVGLQIADVLAAAHAARVLHCDVKPANILVDRAGRFRLADFGSAIELGTDAEPADTLWVTPAWAPPEAFRGEPATEAGDVFSLAATLYALLAGRPPRPMDSTPVPREQAVGLDAPPIAPVPGVDKPLMTVLLRALDDDPAARPSAATFFRQLAMERAGRSRTGRRTLVAAVAAAAVVAVSTSVWLGRDPVASGVPAPASQTSAVGAGASAATAGTGAGSPAAADRSISLVDPGVPAKRLQAARIQGRYPGAADTLLRVQRWEDGGWQTFPMSTRTDGTGEFTAYVELGRPGRYKLRVLDPDAGVESEPLVLRIEG
jgi:protein kinase-like protein